MFTHFLWWSGIGLEVLLLARSIQERLAKRYALFYTYVACVLVVSLLRFVCYKVQPGAYQGTYWYTELLSIVAGYGVIVEIYNRSLANHPGVARLCQNALVLVLFATMVEVAVDTLGRPFASWAYGVAKLGRDLRYAEGALLLVMLGMFIHYRIHGGRNLEGLILGYGFFVGTNVVSLAFLFHPGNESSLLVRSLLPVTYLITLVVWCVALWSYQPEPAPPREDQLERDYNVLALRTRATFARTISSLTRSVRP